MSRDMEELIEKIAEIFDREDEIVLSKVYEGATGGLSPRLYRAALNQISEGGGAAAFVRYAIWANTVRDSILRAIEMLKDQKIDEARPFLIRAANSLSAFAEIQALCDQCTKGHLFRTDKKLNSD